MEKNVHTFIGCDCEYDDAKIVLFGAPYDSTTSFRPGTRFASSAMRNESFGIETYSPYQDKDLLDVNVFDSGDLELPFGNPEGALRDIQSRTSEILDDGKVPCMIGGEHLVTLGAVRAVAEKYPDLHIVHFDAHADLSDGKIYQFGIRSGDRDEFRFAKEHTFMEKFGFFRLDSIVKKLQGKPVYFTLDLDVLDPSEFPGTGTPEAGGVTFKELMFAVEEVAKLNIVGFDVNELSPVYDQTGRSTALACKLLREILLYFYK